MSAATLISVEEYLSTLYDPDMEYVDGVLVEINGGDLPHSAVQRNPGVAFTNKYPDTRAYPEVRSRTRETRFRLPDLVVDLWKREIKGDVIATESPRLELTRDEIFRD